MFCKSNSLKAFSKRLSEFKLSLINSSSSSSSAVFASSRVLDQEL